MSSYGPRYARLYDLFYAGKSYAAEAAFIKDRLVELGVRFPCRLLDVACGTGRHAAAFVSLGCSVVGIDRSEHMLSIASSRVREANFVAGDMRRISFAESAFDVVTCLFDSIGYALEEKAVIGALGEMGRVLVPGGVVIVEFWHAPAMLASFDPVRVKRLDAEGAEILRISETRVDATARCAEVTYSVHEHRSDGTSERFSDVQCARFFDVEEMRRNVESAGLRPEREYAGFDAGRVIDDSTWHVVMVARR